MWELPTWLASGGLGAGVGFALNSRAVMLFLGLRAVKAGVPTDDVARLLEATRSKDPPQLPRPRRSDDET